VTDVAALVRFIGARMDEDAQASRTAGAKFSRERLEAELRRERRLSAQKLSAPTQENVVQLLKLEARLYAPHREFDEDWIWPVTSSPREWARSA
jgi:hypothetical protein